jgi:transposase
MSRFIEGDDRSQATLLPDYLDDYIAEDNPVRAVDAFVDELDLKQLGFAGADPAATGRPAYHAAVLLKLYMYGYLNRIPSSRRLEREAQRNVEVMWLTGRLAPDFKTIADFRRANGDGIRAVYRRFVQLCRELKLFTQAIVAIDSSKFKAVNSRDRNFTPNKVDRRQQQLEESIRRYLDALDTADRTRPAEVEAKGTGVVGYNVQAAVDTKHHLIVTHEVTNEGNARAQLTKMATAAKEEMGKSKIAAVADRGYFNSNEIKACTAAGIMPLVPKPMTSNARAEGRFSKLDFVYDAKSDAYRCRAGERAIFRFNTIENGLTIRNYWSSACPRCPLRPQCTTSSYRRIARWEHERLLEAMQRRLDRKPAAMTLRRRTIEHVFGTLKHWMGWTHFLTRGLHHVGTEMSLYVLAYNLKRVIKLLGMPKTMQAMQTLGA